MNRTVFEVELLAVYNTVHAHRQYLVQPLVILTDNMALVLMLKAPKKLSRYGNIVQRLFEYSFTIQHIRTSENLIPDLMSRVYDNSICELIGDNDLEDKEYVTQPSICSLNSIPFAFDDRKYQENESDFKKICSAVMEKGGIYKNFRIEKELLYCRTSVRSNEYKIYIPERIRSLIINWYHEFNLTGCRWVYIKQ